MLKAVSLSSPMHQGDINLYTDNKTYLNGAGVTALGFWMSWASVQPTTAPTSICDSFTALSTAPGNPTMWSRLDKEIKAANDNGKVVYLTFYPAFPSWARHTYPDTPANRAEHQDKDVARYPASRDSNSPWAWFVQYVASRYSAGAPLNPTGPRPPGTGEANTTFLGNPLGAKLDWIQPLNEPNYMWWPQKTPGAAGNDIGCIAAEMMKSAVTAVAGARSVGLSYGCTAPGLLAPGTADSVGTDGVSYTDAVGFTSTFSLQFQNYAWPSGVNVAWSHHNYVDVKHPPASGPLIVDQVRTQLITNGWPNTGIYLTEGGYVFKMDMIIIPVPQPFDPQHPGGVYWQYADIPPLSFAQQEADQASKVAANFWACKLRSAVTTQPVKMWTQYLLNDDPLTKSRWQSSLRGDWYQGAPNPNPHPIYNSFGALS